MRAKCLVAALAIVAASATFINCVADQAGPLTEPTLGQPGLDRDTGEGDIIPGQYIIVFKDHVENPGRAASEIARGHGLTVRHTYRHALRGFSAVVPGAALPALERHPLIERIQPNRYWYIDTHERLGGGATATPLAASARAAPAPAPKAPTNLRATAASSTEIDLTWKDNDDRQENGYEVHRRNADGSYSLIGSVAQNVTSYRDSGLTPSTTYCYKVRAIGTGNYSSFAGPACATTASGGQPPAAPSSLKATTVDHQAIHLNWLDLSTNEQGFKIERCQGTSVTCSAASFVQIAQGPANVSSYDDTGLAASTDYCYRVRAFNAGGDSNYSNVACAKTNATAGGNPPAAPSSLNASTVDHQAIHLNWLDLSTNEQGFKIERCQGTSATCSAASFVQIAQGPANVSSYDDTGLGANTDYCYRVRAFNAGGNSDYTNVSCAKTDPPPDNPPPVAPGSLNATTVDQQAIHLNWLDLSNNEQGFKIERCQGTSATCSAASFVQIAQGPANVSSYDDSGLAAGTDYCYRVRAFNAYGDSNYSNVDCDKTHANPGGNPPVAPSSLKATTVDHQAIHLNWLDLSTNEQGFKIERCQGTSATCSAASFVQIAQGPANVSSYEDSGLTAETGYCYRVRAFNAIGDSGYSNIACATTDAAPPAGSCTDTGNHDDLATLWNISKVKAHLNPKWQATQTAGCELRAHFYGLDSGVDTDHPDLNVVEALSFVGGSAEDENGHGTHTAGTAAAIDGNGGVVGVAPGAPIHGFKVCNASGQCPEDAIIAAIDEVTARKQAAPNQPLVVNMSLGGPGSDNVMETAIRRSVNAGVVYAISAGNGWFGMCWIPDNAQFHTPARVGDDDINGSNGSNGNTRRVNGAITTTASDSNDRFGNCNYGNPVTVAAPGIGVKSTWLGGGYNTLSGTSMAAPHVAGAVILYLQDNPNATPTQVEQAIKDLLDPWQPVYTPNADGRLNVENL